MSAGHPLTDEDRIPWLKAIRDYALHNIPDGKKGLVIACSSLKKSYRDILRDTPLTTHFLFRASKLLVSCAAQGSLHVAVKGSHDLLMKRMGERKGHFMKKSMLESQLETLERFGVPAKYCCGISADFVSAARRGNPT